MMSHQLSNRALTSESLPPRLEGNCDRCPLIAASSVASSASGRLICWPLHLTSQTLAHFDVCQISRSDERIKDLKILWSGKLGVCMIPKILRPVISLSLPTLLRLEDFISSSDCTFRLLLNTKPLMRIDRRQGQITPGESLPQ